MIIITIWATCSRRKKSSLICNACLENLLLLRVQFRNPLSKNPVEFSQENAYSLKPSSRKSPKTNALPSKSHITSTSLCAATDGTYLRVNLDKSRNNLASSHPQRLLINYDQLCTGAGSIAAHSTTLSPATEHPVHRTGIQHHLCKHVPCQLHVPAQTQHQGPKGHRR